MLGEGRISPALANAALDRHRATGDRFEEALLECGLPESMLLRHLAEMYGTRFISTKTLSGASVPKPTLQRLPRRLAERYLVLPIRFAEDDTLTVVASEPANPQLIESVRVAAGARQVMGLVARPAAIVAAIDKLYGGNSDAFAGLATAGDTLASRPPEAPGSRPGNGSPLAQPSRPSLEESYQDVQMDTSAFDSSPMSPQVSPPVHAALGGSSPEPQGVTTGWVPSALDPPADVDENTMRARGAALGDASKLAEALMIIHERSRASLKSHSVRVARLSYSLCRQLDLSASQAGHAWATGLFHDLGKSQQQHLTALNVWQLGDYEVTARAQYKNPGRLLKSADVPETVLTAILHMYERFDGQGFPDGLADERIPFQSRVLALCDSVADLTLNPDNTLGRIVSPLEACNHIRAQTPKVFDPTLLAHFSRLLVERKLDGAFLSDQSVHGIEKLLG